MGPSSGQKPMGKPSPLLQAKFKNSLVNILRNAPLNRLKGQLTIELADNSSDGKRRQEHPIVPCIPYISVPFYLWSKTKIVWTYVAPTDVMKTKPFSHFSTCNLHTVFVTFKRSHFRFCEIDTSSPRPHIAASYSLFSHLFLFPAYWYLVSTGPTEFAPQTQG